MLSNEQALNIAKYLFQYCYKDSEGNSVISMSRVLEALVSQVPLNYC